MIRISIFQNLRYSEALIHPLLRVLWQLDLETGMFGVQRSGFSWSCVIKRGGRVHAGVCCRRKADSLWGHRERLVGIFSERHVSFQSASTAGWTHGLSISKRSSDTTWQPTVYNSISCQKMTEYTATGCQRIMINAKYEIFYSHLSDNKKVNQHESRWTPTPPEFLAFFQKGRVPVIQ